VKSPAAARRFRLPRRLRVTFEGKAFLLITLGVGIAAVNTGNNLLYLALSVNLSLVIVSGFLSEWALRGISLSVRPASEAFAGGEAFLAVSCSAGGKRFPGFSLSAAMRLGGDTVTVRFPDVAPGGRATRVVPFHPARRGPVGTGAGTLSTLFPFSLFEKTMDLPVAADLLVYPRPLPPADRNAVSPETAPSGNPWNAGRTGAFPRAAREHQPADPVRDIHWKATARMGRWMVKERERETTPAVDVRVPASRSAGDFETALSAACGTVLELERRGIPYRLWIAESLRCDAREPGARPKALAALATADIGRETGEPDR
jgi:uncharacterized protein (DUF58 family)